MCCPTPSNNWQIHDDILQSYKCNKLWDIFRNILNGPYLEKVNKVNPDFKLAKICDGILYLMKMGYKGPEDGRTHHHKHQLAKGN